MDSTSHSLCCIASRRRLLHMVLRHNPAMIGLELDERASVSVDKVIQRAAEAGRPLTRTDICVIMRRTNRYVFVDKAELNVRAAYGHSLGTRLCSLFGNPQPPAGLLFHGTASSNSSAILQKGIDRMTRDHAFLTAQPAIAASYGKRRSPEASVVVVDAVKMYRECRSTYAAHDGTWLVEQVDPRYILRVVNLGPEPR